MLNRQIGQTLQTDMQQVNDVKWKGKIALIDATEYVRASTYGSCSNVYSAGDSPYPCTNNNWMYLNDVWWTMSPASYSTDSRIVWFIDGGRITNHYAYSSNGVRPVVTLSPEVQIISGDGSSNSPYQLSLDNQ